MTLKNELIEQFDAFAPFYDDDYRNSSDDVSCIADLAEDCNGPALELGCGTGRAILPIAERSLEAVGIDVSPQLLSIAQAKVNSGGYNDRISLVAADIRDFRLPQENFDFAFCISNTLMHCTTQSEQIQVMHNAHTHLCNGGLFLIDLFNPDLVALAEVAGLQELADTWKDSAGNQVIKWSIRSVDTASQTQDTVFIYETVTPNGQSSKQICPFTLRYIWPSEGALMLDKVGFELVSIWGNFDGEPYHSESERVIFLARKSG